MNLQEIEASDFIQVDTWQRLAEELSVFYNVCYQDLFEADLLLGQDEGPPILFSGCSDGVICYQDEHYPAADIIKYVPVIDWDGLSNRRGEYPRFILGPAVREERCRTKDRFSIKTDRFTWATFPRLPSWLKKWYSVNVNVDEPQCELLPFGLNNELNNGTPGPELVAAACSTSKDSLLYCNVQWNSYRRFAIKEWAASRDFISYVHEPTVNFRQYLADMARHKFVLCPIGNGFDQYRIYEALYTGSIPVLEDSKWARRMQKFQLPILVVNDMTKITADFLEIIWDECQKRQWNYECLSAAWWGEHLSQCLST